MRDFMEKCYLKLWGNVQNSIVAFKEKIIKFMDLRTEYNKIMQDFTKQGHLKVLEPDYGHELGYYIPHQAMCENCFRSMCTFR